MLYIWAIWAVIAILVVSMARSKNVRKGKASSSSMGHAVKKRKSDASQPVKKGKGKRVASSSESEEISDSDDEIEAMFAEDSESDQEKWARSIANRGFHCERGVKVETFLYSHPIRGIIQEQNMEFVCAEVHGYMPTVVRDFYTNLKENQRVETVLETTVMGRQLGITPDSIAHSLQSLQQIIKLATKFLGTKMISSTNIHNCGRNLKFVCKNEAPYFFTSRLEFYGRATRRKILWDVFNSLWTNYFVFKVT